MYKQGSYYQGEAELSNGAVAEVTRLLGNLELADRAPDLLGEIAEAAHEYQQMRALHVSRDELREEQGRLDRIATLAAELASAMRAIDAMIGDKHLMRHAGAARNWLNQYLALEGAADRADAADRIYQDVMTLARGARRAAEHRAMNPGAGPEADADKYRLARRIAGKYRAITGETDAQMRSHRGTFALVLLHAMRAAGAADNDQRTVNAKMLQAAVTQDVR